jgi:hypothetical protein
LHSSSVTPAVTDAFCVSGSFTPGTSLKRSVVVPPAQLSGECRSHPAAYSRDDDDAGLNPGMQPQRDAAVALQRLNGPHLP